MTASPLSPQITVVAPFYNEADNVTPFISRLKAVLDGAHLDWQLICVNDGSQDLTFGNLVAWRQREPRVSVIDLSRNFGKERAVTAGLDYADGAAVVVMDSDLQHPPEAIPEMVRKWREGNEVVYMVRRQRTDIGPLKRVARAFYYWAFHLASDVTLPHDAGDFRLLDIAVVNAVRAMPEQTRFMKGIYHWVGFRQIGIAYDEERRLHGHSKWSLLRLAGLGIDSITAFSNLPLKLWGMLGAAIAAASVVYAIARVVRTYIWGVDVPGFESLIVAISFLGGLQLLSLGVIGSYIGRIFDEVKGRPLYVVRRVHSAEANVQLPGRENAQERLSNRNPRRAGLSKV